MWILLEVIAVIVNVDILDSTVKKVNGALLLLPECYSSFGALYLELDMTSFPNLQKSVRKHKNKPTKISTVIVSQQL